MRSSPLTGLKNQYIIFVATIIITIVVNSVIIQYELKKQATDGELINLAGRQRLLSTRIVGFIQQIYMDEKELNKIPKDLVDTVKLIENQLYEVHQKLRNIDNLYPADSHQIFKLIEKVKDSIEHLTIHAETYEVYQLLNLARQFERDFVPWMDIAVHNYQTLAEKNLATTRRSEIVLSILTVVVLISGFFFLFIPVFRRVKNVNKNLIEQQKNLKEANEELREKEEDNKVTLEQLSALQDYLASREKQFREIVEDASDMIYELDENGKFSYSNPVLEAVTGYTSEELSQKFYWDILHHDCKENTIQFYNQQLKKRQETSYLELQVNTKNGNTIWVGQNVKMLFRGNYVYKVSVVAREITELISAREALLDSEEKFRSLAENAPVGIFQTDEKGRAIYLNKIWLEISGMDEEVALGDGWMENVYQSDRQNVFTEWHHAVSEGRPFHLEYRFLNPELGTRWVVGHAHKVTTSKGKYIGYIGTIHDVTELKEAQIKLEISEKLYRELLENAQDLTTLSTEEGLLSFLSNSSRKLIGYTPKELVGKTIFSIVHPDDRPVMLQAYQEVKALEDTISLECRIIKKSGGYIWMETLMKAIHDPSNHITSIQITSRDVTLRKMFEEELRDAKTNAEEATKAKSNFLSMMSHEIRTPLNAIIGLTNILLSESPRENQYESLNLLKFSGENLLSIINDILDFSKIEAGKIDLEYISFNFKQTLQDILAMLRSKARERDVELTLSYDENLPLQIYGDSVRLTQIINNLVSNAIKFTENGTVSIHILSRGKVDDKHKMVVEVIDTGIGIETEKLKQIFESFTQARSDTTRKFGGTGLGLSITKLLLQLMGSDIQVESKYNKGSKFFFTLLVEEGEITFDQRPKVGTQQTIRIKEPVVVLLVEDNKVNQIVASNFLRKWNMKVDIANNGLEATKLVASKKYHIILMDLQMPEMDGFDATKIIRSINDPYFKKIPILALTASAMLDTRDKVVEIGMNDFITKPFNPVELEEKIHQYASVMFESRDKGLALSPSNTGTFPLHSQKIIDAISLLREYLYKAHESKIPGIFTEKLEELNFQLFEGSNALPILQTFKEESFTKKTLDEKVKIFEHLTKELLDKFKAQKESPISSKI